MKLNSTYRRDKSYDWNYVHPPVSESNVIPTLNSTHPILGFELRSPLGIPAGPLLNGAWVLYYAAWGFDMLTYKTVRSVPRECYEGPNLVPVSSGQLNGSESCVPVTDTMSGSWAVSFGMPSKHPDVWRADVEKTRRMLRSDQILSVSVVGTEQPGWSFEQLADDYARCAQWAADSGADCIETNLSCPNVSSTDGQIYQHADQAKAIVERVRDRIGSTPFIIKIGHVVAKESAEALVAAVAGSVDAIATTNSIATQVVGADNHLLFDGQKRGICGAATRDASLRQTEMFREAINRQKASIELIGVGGVQTAEHVKQYLSAGACCVHLATEPMINPAVGIEILGQLDAL